MKILHISLTEQGRDYASLRYFWDNPNNYKEHRLPLAEIKGLSDRAEAYYYTRLPIAHEEIGQALYNWLDKSDRILANTLQEPHPEGLIIAIATYKGLAHLPWELLHDGECFLVQKRPSIIPVRWMSQGKPIEIANSPQNRPLNLLFMATSPLGLDPKIYPELDYEAEEGQILAATKRTPLDLRVEESGWLEELGYVVSEYGSGHFDIFHLTGHACTQNKKPYFITENEYGSCIYSYAEDIADALKFPLPSLIFLSGCRTGYSSENTVLSMAEELLNMGAKTVLGWGAQVLDTDASAASSQFYGELSQGRTITQALASTYQALIHLKARDWHKLRFYLATILPQALVTPLRRRGRKQLPKPTSTPEFRDDQNRLRVAKREDFVGRRRQLQNCLRTLKTDYDKVGVLIHGMGGWGKSSIASRLWDRLPEYEKILWWRNIDESKLIKKLKKKLDNSRTRELISDLENYQLELESRFTDLFNQLAELGEGLEPLRKAELTKKINRLEHFSSDKLSEDIRNRALNLADGNPLLLEFLNNKILGEKDAEAKLTELEQSPELWKDQIIYSELYQLVDESLQEVLSDCLIYEIPVPMVALEAVCKPNYKIQLQRAKQLALLEVSSEAQEENKVYYVSRILPRIISTIQLPEAPKVYSLYRKAHEKLYQLWGKKENESNEKWREIFRLLFADKDNPDRFRQGFSQMLEVQLNEYADNAFESGLRRLKEELPKENFYCRLEDYLSQGNWRKADEETAWLFCLVMVQKDYGDWSELCQNFPCKTLNKIDQLWVKYSQGHFGFSIQKRIWESVVGEKPEVETFREKKFEKQLGWLSIANNNKMYKSLSFLIDSPEGNFPALYATDIMEWNHTWGVDGLVLGGGKFWIHDVLEVDWEERGGRNEVFSVVGQGVKRIEAFFSHINT